MIWARTVQGLLSRESNEILYIDIYGRNIGWQGKVSVII